MKGIVYCDRANPCVKYGYVPHEQVKRTERINLALKELEHVGNINIYYDRGTRKPLELITERMN